MQKKVILNGVYSGSLGKKSLIDLVIPENFNGQILVFVHGYMGYKDWGAWNLMQDSFTNDGFGFCKFNLTHNGGTIENGIDFPDLESFASNTYSKELADIGFALDFLETQFSELPPITLIGHSRGGGMVILTGKDKRVKNIITLAAISSVAKRFENVEMIEAWKETGVRYLQNQRTKQDMPHDFKQYIDFMENKTLLDIEKACLENQKPILHIHGDKDSSVSIDEGKANASWTRSHLHIIENTDHVFGASQPWESEELPEKLAEAIGVMKEFLG